MISHYQTYPPLLWGGLFEYIFYRLIQNYFLLTFFDGFGSSGLFTTNSTWVVIVGVVG
jgi:hypothetical protein